MKFKIGDKLRIKASPEMFRILTFGKGMPMVFLDSMINNIDYKKPITVVANVNHPNYDFRVEVNRLEEGKYYWGYSTKNMQKAFGDFYASKRPKRLRRVEKVRKIRNDILTGGKNARRIKTRKRIS